jgi:dienelactone hydrolase
MPVYVLIPDGATGRTPAVINPHGHDSGGKLAPAGCRERPEIADRIDRYRYDYGVQYARAGLISFCPDARGFGERRERSARAQSILSSSCAAINQMGYPLGQTVTGMWAWDVSRLVDYIRTRRDCDPDRIGCAGLSGGGLQTLWATALDERIRAAVVSGYFYGYRESLLEGYENCSCNFVPHLYEHVDMGDIAALVAPRPLLIETGTRDPLNGRSGMKNVQSQLRIARGAYKVVGEPKNLVHDTFDDGHRWNGVVAVPWLVERLGRE